MVAEIADALKQYKDKMVFVGGAVVSLYTDDPAADEIRPTQDIDLTLNVISLGNWNTIQEELGQLGFSPDPFGQAICSYKYKNIPVDIMASEDGPFGPSNSWYKTGFENLWTAKAEEQEINILSAPCYLATKFEAFNNRGSDYRTSHDIEDIIYILDNRISIVKEIEEDNASVRQFIRKQILKIKNLGLLEEVIIAHIHPLMIEERMAIITEKISKIIE